MANEIKSEKNSSEMCVFHLCHAVPAATGTGACVKLTSVQVCVCVLRACVIESESACAAQSSLTTGEVEEWEDADWTAGAFKWKEHARCEVCECVCAHAMHYTCTQRPAEYTSNAGTACMSGVGEEHRWTSAAQLEAKNVEFT